MSGPVDLKNALELGFKRAHREPPARSAGGRQLRRPNRLLWKDDTKEIEFDPKDFDAYNCRGVAYGNNGDFDRAAANFTRAIEIDPKDALPYDNRCWLRAKANRDLPLALADCDAGVGLAPNNAKGLSNRGFLYLRLDRLDEAIADYDPALKINPRLAVALYGRGLCERKKGDQAGGDADVGAARAIQADIADEFAKYGMN